LAIIDPRTGEKQMDLGSNKMDQLMFCEKVTTFLSDFETPFKESELENYQNGNSKQKNEIIKVDDEDEIVELNSNINNGKPKLNGSKFSNVSLCYNKLIVLKIVIN
jgi:hypothetical protein